MLSSEDLAFLDELARHLVEGDKQVRYDLARSPAEKEAVFHLRYLTVIELGWVKPEDFPDGLERDEDDDEALHVVAWIGDELAATARIVLPSPQRLLPTEKAFAIVIEPTGQVVDCSRALVAPPYRARQQHLFFGVLGRVWQELRQHNYAELCGTATKQMVRYYDKGRFSVKILGEAKSYWGEARFPIKFDIPATLKRLQGYR